MFQKAKNIDTAFKQVRLTALVVIIGSILICAYTIYQGHALVATTQQRVYVLSDGKVLQARASSRRENIPVEARDHVKTFHHWFFTLAPDDKVIREHISKALYLADGSAKRQYDNLEEKGYYAQMISGNVSQTIKVDSVQVNIENHPYAFRCYATQKLVRTTSIVTRRLITNGVLRNVSRSDNNPHGFLIERWQILENRDIQVKNRR
ncbi:conjugative transposon protein TraK [Sinomicrobium weinanense]|uniref:Conjugative transposon protein TraK n=1 Tax=Sinomicrobium weinanense TaxID=2842200 RepID=A0A926Q2V9_9FLAO|nr:conjugative transposon protein TraK [Sinomicrobium weinanense]MBC9795356.1 conjugative transposon protein TraK [Sinomicrobium weinanense]MBU3122929.1 conjugative transposon protein TraK [Sinomicrobium weinanense]